MMRKRATFGFWVKIGWFTYFWFVAEALTLKALVTLFVWFGHWGFTSYFALALSLSDRYPLPSP